MLRGEYLGINGASEKLDPLKPFNVWVPIRGNVASHMQLNGPLRVVFLYIDRRDENPCVILS